MWVVFTNVYRSPSQISPVINSSNTQVTVRQLCDRFHYIVAKLGSNWIWCQWESAGVRWSPCAKFLLHSTAPNWHTYIPDANGANDPQFHLTQQHISAGKRGTSHWSFMKKKWQQRFAFCAPAHLRWQLLFSKQALIQELLHKVRYRVKPLHKHVFISYYMPWASANRKYTGIIDVWLAFELQPRTKECKVQLSMRSFHFFLQELGRITCQRW